MTDSVTVNGRTYTSDSNPSTGMGNGGSRVRLIPMLGDTIVEIGLQVQSAAATAGAGFTGTSTTSASIGTGSKSLTTQAAKLFAVGEYVKAYETATPANYMIGQVTAYDSSTGVLAFTVASGDTGGSGTITAWTIALSGVKGATGAKGDQGDQGLIGATGTVAASGDGSAGTPAWSFVSDPDTGIYRSGSGTMEVSSNGSNILTLIEATQGEAEAGTDAKKLMTPRRVSQAIAALVPAARGTGGTTIAGDTTLTNASAGAIVVTPTGYGYYATLPDATTMTKGTGVFAIYNAGDYDYGVKDSTGTKLGWIPPRTGATIALADKATSAGIWDCAGLVKLGVTAEFVNATITGQTPGGAKAVEIDAGRTLFLVGNTELYGVVYDRAGKAWGSATLIRSGIGGAFCGIVCATDKALVVSCDGTTGIEAVTLSISGTTITVNTANKATASSSGSVASFGDIIAVGSSWVFSYAATAPSVRAITISTNTPTIGAASSPHAGAVPPILFASGSVLRTITGYGSAGGVIAQPYTVSGTTLTAGTSATASSDNTSSQAALRTMQHSNGNILAFYAYTSNYVSVFRLTSTTEAVSSVALGAIQSITLVQYSDAIDLGSNKTLFVAANNGTTFYSNIITDTAGTASAGTPVTMSISDSSVSAIAALGLSGSTARIGLKTSDVNYQVSLDVSGSSPTFLAAKINRSVGSVAPSGSNYRGVQSPKMLKAGDAAYGPCNSGLGDGFKSLMFLPGGLGAQSLNYAVAGAQNVAGANAAEAWAHTISGASSSVGLVLHRVEAAA